MNNIIKDQIKRAYDVLSTKITIKDDYSIKGGRVFCVVEHKDGTAEFKDFGNNLVVLTGDILVAGLAKGDAIPAITHMALGQGDTWWDPLNPPAPVRSDTYLKSEYIRKAITNTQYVLTDGTPSGTPTHIVDFVTVFLEGEPSGALMELGLFGGTDADLTNGGYMVAYRINPVWNIPVDAAITWVWRVTF